MQLWVIQSKWKKLSNKLKLIIYLR
jgi:hypothetical protein